MRQNMATADLFKRSLEMATSFLDMTRQQAESMVKEWVDAGDLGRGTAHKAVDDLLQLSRKGREELSGLVRREVRNQLAALGVATKDDVARIEAKLDAATKGGAQATRATAQKTSAQKASAQKTSTKNAAAKNAAAKNAAPEKTADSARQGTKAAPITKAASTEKRSRPPKADPGS
jgi:polyhydroxyalkanoate synthesis regulator phasin